MQAIDVQTVVFREGNYHVAQCLDVDVSSFGDSDDDALANLREALSFILRTLLRTRSQRSKDLRFAG